MIANKKLSGENTVIAIIPARGGSKGIPRKNVKILSGKPLLVHSILQAKQTLAISRIMVSTDDDEISTVSLEWGVEIIPRPAEISGDTASSESALVNALDYLKEIEGYDPELVVFLQATSPCRKPGEIQDAIDTLRKENADSLLSVGPVHGFLWRVGKDGSARSFSYDHLNRPRRQDAPEDLIENGSIYIFKPWVLRKFNNRLGGKIAIHRMSALDSFQIDEPGDFELLEFLMAYRSSTSAPGPSLPASRSLYPAVFPDLPSSISYLLRSVRLLVLDFDGVLTDKRVIGSEDGKESVHCSREDGMGIELARKAGHDFIVLSKEKSPIVTARCSKLHIECIQDCENKLATLQSFCINRGLNANEIAYVGNDVNDVECMSWVGLPIAVADAVPSVKAAAKWITCKTGGAGAVREVCDLLLTHKNK